MATIDTCIDTLRALVKVALQARPTSIRPQPGADRIVIMANGPSLADTIACHAHALRSATSMAVNFAANTPTFALLRPDYYILVDPHFFSGRSEKNFTDLWVNLAAVDWDMTLIVPRSFKDAARRMLAAAGASGSHLRVLTINTIGAEGFRPLRHFLYRRRLAMPRPRNVLIAAIMAAIWLGFRNIDIVGADHSWTETLGVDSENRLVAVQRHFYDEGAEQSRVAEEYRGYRLHQILGSLAIAFRSYHHIAEFAATRGIAIRNLTPRSYIDAFSRDTMSGS